MEAWERELPPDYPSRQFLLEGIKDGFRITNKGVSMDRVFVGNYKSSTAPRVRDVVESQICEELRNDRYRICNAPKTVTSALGAIPKPQSDKVRIIHDCSRPFGHSVNDRADNRPFSYQSLQDALANVHQGDWMAKLDLASAYRSVRVHEKDYDVTGVAWIFKGSPYIHVRYSPNVWGKTSPKYIQRIVSGSRGNNEGKRFH